MMLHIIRVAADHTRHLGITNAVFAEFAPGIIASISHGICRAYVIDRWWARKDSAQEESWEEDPEARELKQVHGIVILTGCKHLATPRTLDEMFDQLRDCLKPENGGIAFYVEPFILNIAEATQACGIHPPAFLLTFK